jgi:hypothetical protein
MLAVIQGVVEKLWDGLCDVVLCEEREAVILKDRDIDNENVGFVLLETDGVTETESGRAAVNPSEGGGMHIADRRSAHSPAYTPS